MSRFNRLVTVLGVAASGLLLSGSTARAELIYGLSTDNNLFTFDSAAPGTVLSGTFINGLTGNGEHLVGIDFRPSNGQLYGISSASRVYTINTSNGTVSPVGTGFTPSLNGTRFGIDFNPVPDAIRIVSDADQNLRVSPVTGATLGTDLAITYGTAVNPNLAGAAYTNNDTNASTGTTLFTIDSGTDTINIQNPPNNGTQIIQISLGFDASALVGFDISYDPTAVSNVGYISAQSVSNGYSQFYTLGVNGAGTALTGGPVGGTQIGGGLFVRDIAVAVVPEPASLGLAGVAALGLFARRRKA